MDPINSNQSGQGMNTNMPPKMANSTAPMGAMPAHSHKRLYWLLAVFFILSQFYLLCQTVYENSMDAVSDRDFIIEFLEYTKVINVAWP